MVLQIFGYLASIAAIPLAVYLYLRNREVKFPKVRQEIREILSYQIGEGRNLSTFKVQSVIDSKLREHKFRSDVISSNEVIEDLVAETITNPMLEKERKVTIINNLQNIHSAGQVHRIVMQYPISSIDLLRSISSTIRLTPEDLELVKTKDVPPETIEVISKPKPFAGTLSSLSKSLSSLFALFAAIITIVSLAFSVVSEISKHFVVFLSANPYILSALLGAGTSIIGFLLAYFISYASHKKRKKKESISSKQVTKYDEESQQIDK